MGYGRGNVGTGMHLVGRTKRSRVFYTADQLRAIARSNAITRNVTGAVGRNACDDFFSSLSKKQRSYLLNCYKTFQINRAIMRHLAGENARPGIAINSDRIGRFRLLSWEWGDWDYDHIYSDACFSVGALKNGLAFLNVFPELLLKANVCSPIQLYMEGVPFEEMPLVEGFGCQKDKRAVLYELVEDETRLLKNMSERECGERMARLIVRLTNAFTNAILKKGSMRRPSRKCGWNLSTAHDVLDACYSECQELIRVMLESGSSENDILKDFDEKVWFYRGALHLI